VRLSKALAGGCALLRVSCAPTSRFVRLSPWDSRGLYPLMDKGVEGESLLWY